jgi:hypothetical protein
VELVLLLLVELDELAAVLALLLELEELAAPLELLVEPEVALEEVAPPPAPEVLVALPEVLPELPELPEPPPGPPVSSEVLPASHDTA